MDRQAAMSAAPSDDVECRYHGRNFTRQEMAVLRALIADPAGLNRYRLAKEFCRRIGWFRRNGELKDMMARVTMLKMHRDGIIVLPPPRKPGGVANRKQSIPFTQHTDPPLLFRIPETLAQARPLQFVIITGAGAAASRRWNEYIARYHYLGYKTLVGAQMRYAVYDGNGVPLAMLGFSTAAWKTAPRDTFIGWSTATRQKNLPRVCDNSRFLILPWAHLPNLGSHILSIVRQRLPDDWRRQYHTEPVLIETFVEKNRFNGGVYRAAGWRLVGTTQGRGRYDRYNLYDKPKKDIWLCPLRKNWKNILNQD